MKINKINKIMHKINAKKYNDNKLHVIKMITDDITISIKSNLIIVECDSRNDELKKLASGISEYCDDNISYYLYELTQEKLIEYLWGIR